MLRLPKAASFKPLTHLYWGKFGFKVLLERPTRFKTKRFSTSYYSFTQKLKVEQELAPILPKGKDQYRRNFLGYSIIYYFVDENEAQHFIDNLDPKLVKLVEVQCPEDHDHKALLETDNKIVTREKWFHDKYEWRIKFVPLNKVDRAYVKNWIDSFYESTDNDVRYRYLDSYSSCILYLTDEDDVTIAKLALSGFIRKAERVVILKNKNNKEGNDSHEPNDVLQVG